MATELRESFICENQFIKSSEKNVKGVIAHVGGIFQKADTRNANGRVYKLSLWEGIMKRPDIQSAIVERRMLGELGHPDCVETTAINVSHIVTELKLLPNGEVYGEADILDTPSGRILKTLYDAQVKMGISSRGYLPEGSNLYPEGKDLVVPDDFELVTFDFVIEPSTPGANPTIKEGVKKTLTSILSESRDKVNKEVVSYIEGLDSSNLQEPQKKESSIKVLRESSSSKPVTKNVEKEAKLFMENKKYIENLQSIISDLKERYLVAESIIEDLMGERVTANDILKDVSKRYLTSEAVIKEFRSYALKLEQTLAEVTNLQQVSEGVIEELRNRYTLSEGVIADLKERYTLSQQELSSLRDSLKGTEDKQTEDLSVKESVIADLQKRCKISEDVITQLASEVKAKEQDLPKKEPVPASYFEGVAEKYNISISEAKTLFKSLGCKRSAFEFHLEERKKLVTNHYSEFPYMTNKAAVENVYESKDHKDQDEDRIARIVAKGF